MERQPENPLFDPGPGGEIGPSDSLIEVSITCDAEAVEALYEVFARCCSHGAVIEELDPQGQAVVQVKGYLGHDRQARHGLEEAVWHLSQIRPLGELCSRELQAEDWATAWQQQYPSPQRIGRIVIRFPWQSYQARPEQVLIEIEPGMAFGTGLHPTTRGCLALLEKHCRPGARVLDVGTGSGILAIAALRLGAAAVVGLDIDAQALRVARQNAQRNGLEERLELRPGTLSGNFGEAAYDLVLSNILAGVIVELAPRVRRALRPGGRWIAGGILEEQLGTVKKAGQEHGFRLGEQDRRHGWASIVLSPLSPRSC